MKLSSYTLLLSLVLAPVALGQVSVSVPRDGALRLDGVSVGGQVLVFGVSQDRHGLHLRTRTWETILISDATNLEIEVGTLLTNRSIWFVEDLVSGSSVTFPVDPDQFSPLPLDLTRQDLRQRASFLEAVLTRRGVGAWRYSGGDGGGSDADGIPDGRVKLSLTALVPVGFSPANPGPLQPNDQAFVVDTETMQFGVVALR